MICFFVLLHCVTSFNSASFTDNSSTSSIYDELGRVTQQTDQANRTTQFGFDALGRLSSVTQVMDAVDETKNLVTTYGYDELGQKLWQQDAKGQRTEFSYDNMGRMTGRKLPGGEAEVMAYNIGGQLTGKSDFAGRITKYAYDQRGRLILKTPDASLNEPQVSFSYPNGLTKVARRGGIANAYKYDAQRGWLDSVQSPNGLIEYSYDTAGNRTKVRITGKDNGVRETDYSYDELNRVDQVSRPGLGVLANYNYNAVGNVSNVTRANGVLSAYGYDELHRLTAIEHKKGTEVLSQFNYALSADGKRNTLQEYLKYPAAQSVASVNRTVFYGYDNVGRLTGEQRQSTQALTAGGTIERTGKTIWGYDKASNRLSQSVSNYEAIGTAGTPTSTHDTGYQYNTNDWLTTSTSEHSNAGQTTTSTTNYEYNENGSQTAIVSKVGETDQKRVPYFYDFEEKLVGIGAPADAQKHAYAYDAEGNRVTETNYNGPDTKTRHYLVDPQNSNAQVVEEYDNTGVLQAHYDWNDAELLRESSLNGADTEISQPLADGHGSTRQLMDEAGAVSDVYSFDAWGNAQENVGSSVNPYRYNGQRLDASGLYHLRARQYSTGTGRFLSHDPLMGSSGNPITQHRYLYAGADPANNVDPSGRVTLTQVALAGFGVGLAYLAYKGVSAVYTAGQGVNTQLNSKLMVSQDLDPALPEIDYLHQRSHNQKLHELKEALGAVDDNGIRLLEIKIYSTGTEGTKHGGTKRGIGGSHNKLTPYTLYISQNAVDAGALALAMVIFAEFQHSPDGGSMNEEDAQVELEAVRAQIEPEKLNDYIRNLSHGGLSRGQ